MRLPGNGAYVQWTTTAPTNTLVVRFSIPDNAAGAGQNSSLNIYVNNTLHKAIPLTSKYMWQYGDEAAPSNSPGSGGPRHIYDEANVMLNSTVPAGATIKLQKDAANATEATVDFVNLELVSPRGNPDPARYKVPAGTSQQDVQAALDAARQDTNSLGVYLPAGTYENVQQVHRSTSGRSGSSGPASGTPGSRRRKARRTRTPASTSRPRPAGRRSSTSPSSATTRPARTGRARCGASCATSTT